MSKRAGTAAPVAMAAGATGKPTPRLRDRLAGVRRGYHQLIGIPDYESYLAHMAEHHPDAPALSRQEFCAEAIDRKYGKGGPRCC